MSNPPVETVSTGADNLTISACLGISERTLRYRLAKAREQGEEIDAPRSWAASA